MTRANRLSALAGCVLACALLVSAPGVLSVRALDVIDTTAAGKIESNFPAAQTSADGTSSTAGYPSRSLEPLRGAVFSTSASLLAQAGAAFQATQPNFNVNYYVVASSTAASTAYLKGGYDFGVLGMAPTQANLVSNPSIVYYPLHGNAAVVGYNLPATVTLGQTLTLKGTTLCAIFWGNLTTWDDPRIAATNPGMTFPPGHRIVNAMPAVGSATHQAFSSYCNKIDANFARIVGPAASLPTYPPTLRTVFYASLQLAISGTADTPYTLTVSQLALCTAVNLPVAAFLNAVGNVVLPTSNAMALNMFETATSGYPAGTNQFDLTNPTTPNAWPIMSMTYVWMDKTAAISTCANKKMMLSFFDFFYTSDVVRSIADSLSLAAFSTVFVSLLDVQNSMQSDLTCLGDPLSATSVYSGSLAVNALAAGPVTLYSSFYLTIDTNVAFSNTATDESLAVERIVLGEQSAGVVNVAALQAADLALLQEGLSALIPAFVAGVVPIFQLPAQLLTFAAAASTASLSLPSLYPLLLDVETCALLFLGQIGSWTDDRLVKLNPQLPPWFTASGAPTELSLVVGATSAADPLSGAKLLFQVFAKTSAAAAYPWAFAAPAAATGPLSNPFLTVQTQAAAGQAAANISLIDTEARLSVKVSGTPGAVSYTAVTPTADPTTQFQMVTPSSPQGVAASPDSMSPCGSRFSATVAGQTADEFAAQAAALGDWGTQQNWVDSIHPEAGCWPFSTMLSYATKLSYSTSVNGAGCTDGLRSLEFLHYAQITDILSQPTEGLGLARLAASAAVQRYSVDTLQSATCDGTTLLIVLPYVYRISSAISSFSLALFVIGVVLLTATAIVVFAYRHHPVIRSASAPFLLLILLGLALLCVALSIWGFAPTRTSCAGFLWTANLGFMCVFAPLFLKTWRGQRTMQGEGVGYEMG